MNKSVTYRFIASLLSLSILIGVSVPAGLHAMSKELCDEMQEMHHPQQPVSDHAEDCPMNGQHAELPAHQHHSKTDKTHHQSHDLGFACACSVDEAPLSTQAPAQIKVKVPALKVVQTFAEIHTDESEANAYPIPVSDTYSQPPIYLANESFLN
ncbi:hypothetical protein [Gracilimonas mengyeensis]|uniref:Uncharacterized protein n=1 Tax=Gracilimonas mengyeensis TaxID=1302730 RepID=A0A521CX63_9BACT|nr:hypothetical protein [Gracilimonas mengyeensis]SMO64025.1 hypothetical protein SAMN06265219_106201 [Gracilimonas mengyeensis]